MSQHDPRRATRGDTLVPLGSMPGARFADGEPDIRGWEVRASDGGRLGVVDELLIDPNVNEIAAFAVIVGDGGTPVVLSTAATHIDDRAHAVVADLTRAEFAALPRRTAGGAAAGVATGRAQPPTGHPSGHQTAYPASGTPAVQGGTEVTVERTADGDEIIRVPIVEEELVVERRPVVKDVVVIHKRRVQEERVVEADLRRERVHIDRQDFDTGQPGAAGGTPDGRDLDGRDLDGRDLDGRGPRR
jgi:hypothetical protein